MDTDFTLIGQLFQIIESFTFLPLETAVHQFSNYLQYLLIPLLDFSHFFQIVCNHEGYLPKLFLFIWADLVIRFSLFFFLRQSTVSSSRAAKPSVPFGGWYR